MRIGVISDTHGVFDRAIARHFAGVEHILHAGDIGRPEVIEQLEQIAPVTASRPDEILSTWRRQGLCRESVAFMVL